LSCHFCCCCCAVARVLGGLRVRALHRTAFFRSTSPVNKSRQTSRVAARRHSRRSVVVLSSRHPHPHSHPHPHGICPCCYDLSLVTITCYTALLLRLLYYLHHHHSSVLQSWPRKEDRHPRYDDSHEGHLSFGPQ
jgi:hypothetical protein